MSYYWVQTRNFAVGGLLLQKLGVEVRWVDGAYRFQKPMTDIQEYALLIQAKVLDPTVKMLIHHRDEEDDADLGGWVDVETCLSRDPDFDFC